MKKNSSSFGMNGTGPDDRIGLITGGSIRKGLMMLALPAALMMISVILFELVDMFWVGRTSAAGTAAVASSAYLIWAVKALSLATAGGINTLIARNAGRRDWQRVGYWFWRGTNLSLAFALLLAVTGLLILDDILSLMGLEPETATLAGEYLFYFILSLPLVFLYVIFDNTFRAIGDTRTPLYITTIALVINGVLDPFLIFGWWGFPEMGVAGAALASLIAHLIGNVLFILRLNKTEVVLKVALPAQGRLADWYEITRIGSPLAMSGFLFSVIYVFITRIVAEASLISGDPSDIHISAMGIGQRWESLAYYACVAVSGAVATMVGQNLGVGKPDRARKAANQGTFLLLIFTAVVSVLFVAGGHALGYIIMPDDEVAAAAARYLFVIGLFEWTMAFEFGLEGAFIGSGNTLPPMLISVPLTAARIPAGYFFAVTEGYGVDAMWWVIGITTLLKGILFALWYFRGKWINTSVRT